MGKRGPARKPTALKLIEGESRPSRVNKAEPKPRPGMIEPPTDLRPEARAVWDRLAPDLEAKGILTPWDVDPFAAYCDAVVERERARKLIEPALLVRGRLDGLVTNPAWRIYRDAAGLVRALAQEFGLTPAARAGLRAEEVGADELLEILTPIRQRSAQRRRGTHDG